MARTGDLGGARWRRVDEFAKLPREIANTWRRVDSLALPVL